MAEETMMNGELGDDRTVEIAGTGDESPEGNKISDLVQKIAVLEQEKSELTHENEIIKERAEKSKSTIEELSNEKSDLAARIRAAEQDKKVLESVASRASQLEAEVSRLQHDLISAMNELEESHKELSEFKSSIDGLRKSETEANGKLASMEKERDLLLKKLEEKSGEHESEIAGLKKTVAELEQAVRTKAAEIEELEQEKRELLKKLEENEKVLNGFHEGGGNEKQREVNGNAGDVVEENKGREGVMSGLGEKDWQVVVGSAVGAVAIMGLVCYAHYVRKR